jgi:hypothetical protein
MDIAYRDRKLSVSLCVFVRRFTGIPSLAVDQIMLDCLWMRTRAARVSVGDTLRFVHGGEQRNRQPDLDERLVLA